VRYFFYRNENRPSEYTVIIVDENRSCVTLFPDRSNYSMHKSDWLDYYRGKKEHPESYTDRFIFEICENQFKKFKNHGVMPINWDW
jgi:hypothetical protein